MRPRASPRETCSSLFDAGQLPRARDYLSADLEADDAYSGTQAGYVPEPLANASALKANLSSVETTSGRRFNILQRRAKPEVSYEQIIAARSEAKAGRAQRSYYGIDIHKLLDDARSEALVEEAKDSLAGRVW